MLFILVKYRIRMFFSVFRGGTKFGKSAAVIAAFLGFTALLFSVCAGIYKFISADPVKGVKFMDAIVAVSFHGVFVLLLFTGLSLAIFTIYFGKDLEFLSCLPVKRSTIYLYKFIEALFLNVRFSSIFLIPMLILLGIFNKASIMFYVFALAMAVLMASIPGSLGIIISSLFVRRVTRSRMKNVMAIAGSFLGLALWAGINALMSSLDRGTSPPTAASLPAMGIIASPVFAYLPSGWATRATLSAAAGNWQSSVLPIFFLVLSSAVLSYFAMDIASRFYARGMIEESAGSVSVSAAGAAPGGSPLAAYLRRDLTILYRQPQLLTQILLMYLLMLLFPFLAKDNQPGTIGNLPLSLPTALFAPIFGSQFSCRLIPMEGMGFWCNLMIPGGGRLMLLAKFILGISITLLATGIAGLIHLGAGIAPGMDYIVILGSLALIGFGMGFPMGVIFADFAWEHPKRMLKSGGSFILVFLTIILGMALYLFAAFLGKFVPLIVILPIFSAIVLIAALIISSVKLTNLEWISQV